MSESTSKTECKLWRGNEHSFACVIHALTTASPGTELFPSKAAHLTLFPQPPPSQEISRQTRDLPLLSTAQYQATMHVKWYKAVGAAAVVLFCILDAAQSSPVSPKRPLDSTELYYGAHDEDEVMSSHKDLEKKARTSSGAAGATPQQEHRLLLDLNKVPSSYSLDTTEPSSGAHVPLKDGATSAHKHPEKEARPSSSSGGAKGQQVGSPLSNSVSSAPPSTRQASSDAYESHSRNEKQGEASTSDASWQMSRRPRASKAQKGTRGARKGSSSFKTGSTTQMNALQTSKYDRNGHKFLTSAPGELWHEGPEIKEKYSTRGVVKAKALAIQQHVPEYPMTPEEYSMVPPRRDNKRTQTLGERKFRAHRDHVRRTYARMATNQVKRLHLLDGVSLPVEQADSREARLAAMRRRLPLPAGAPLQDYRTLLSDSDKREPSDSECFTLQRCDVS